jgi:hypothetical protein
MECQKNDAVLDGFAQRAYMEEDAVRHALEVKFEEGGVLPLASTTSHTRE